MHSYPAGNTLSSTKAIIPGIQLLLDAFKPTSYRLFGLPQILPKSVVLISTFKCNSRCKTCNIWQKYVKNPSLESQEMTLDEFIIFIDNNEFLQDINLSGGEVYLRDDIVDMWQYLDCKGLATAVTTNGVNVDLIKRKESILLKKLSGKNNRELQISIDGLGETHDFIRGISGNYEKAIELLNWAFRKERQYPFFKVSITHNITPYNYHQLSEFVKYFINFGLKPSQISIKVAQTSSLLYDNIDTYEFVNSSRKMISAVEGIQREIPYYRHYYYTRLIPTFLENSRKPLIPCYAGFTICYIDPCWNVYPCSFLNTKIGNLRDYNFELKKLWETDVIKKVQDRVKKGLCPHCWISCFSSPSIRCDVFSLLRFGIRKLIQRDL